jgi:hypothetical protein
VLPSIHWQSEKRPVLVAYPPLTIRRKKTGLCHLPYAGSRKRDQFLSPSILWQKEERPVLVAFCLLAIRRETGLAAFHPSAIIRETLFYQWWGFIL